jgi:hypothetical protein
MPLTRVTRFKRACDAIKSWRKAWLTQLFRLSQESRFNGRFRGVFQRIERLTPSLLIRSARRRAINEIPACSSRPLETPRSNAMETRNRRSGDRSGEARALYRVERRGEEKNAERAAEFRAAASVAGDHSRADIVGHSSGRANAVI